MQKNSLEQIPLTQNIPDTVLFINQLFNSAIEENASDIHVEPTPHFLLIRFRKDGEFIIKHKIASEYVQALITRLKVLGNLKIDENKKPQDGKIVYEKSPQETIDIRISTLPTHYGEKVVLRVLKQNLEFLSLDNMGFYKGNLEKIKETLKSKHGIILIAGPTGSGKSTTLFSILTSFDPLKYNISTLEDPIEYHIHYVNQSQIKPDIGYTFATGLRSLVRQDPDIIMVGEIRDKETAQLSIEAALTGHLVLSTIHTNSASATIQRLINMHIEPFLIATALKMVISQRLIKKICPHCMKITNTNEALKKRIYEIMSDIMDEESIDQLEFYEGAGCEQCNFTGYSGRIAIHEVLIVGEYLEDAIMSRASANEIEKIAKEHGMITLTQDAIIKAAQKQTTLEEALKFI